MERDIRHWLDKVLQASKHEFLVLESHLPPEMHDAKGAINNWSAKDVFAHLTFWLEVFSYNIEARSHSRTLIDTDNYRVLNREAWQARKAHTWDRVWLDLDRAFSAVRSQLSSLSTEQLTNASCFSTGDRPLVEDFMYEAIEHPMHHWMSLYRQAGAEEMAGAMLERVQDCVRQDGQMMWSQAVREKIRTHRESLTS